jgi:hypothetical protein
MKADNNLKTDPVEKPPSIQEPDGPKFRVCRGRSVHLAIPDKKRIVGSRPYLAPSGEIIYIDVTAAETKVVSAGEIVEGLSAEDTKRFLELGFIQPLDGDAPAARKSNPARRPSTGIENDKRL